MQIRLKPVIRVIACVFAIAAFVMPANFTAPLPVSADPGIMKWDTVSTPGSVARRWDIMNLHGIGANTGQGSETIDMAAANSGRNIFAVIRTWFPANTVIATIPAPGPPPVGFYKNLLRGSRDSGISWTNLLSNTTEENLSPNVFQIVTAPDSNGVYVSTAAMPGAGPGLPTGPKQVWVSQLEPGEGTLVFNGTGLEPNETIRCIDISPDYGGKRDIAFGTVGGSNGGRWFVRSARAFSGTNVQMNANGTAGNALGTLTTSGIDYFAIKFSPTYSSDGSVALVYATDNTSVGGGATYYNVALRDINANTTQEYAFPGNGIEVKNPVAAVDASPASNYLNMVDLQLPSDFSGQSSSLRRAYISLDAFGNKSLTSQDGIYRIDDTTPYLLMDTSGVPDKSIYSIAYFGTYASGKLLAGERAGYPCSATVPTWFTDSPTTCPIPCWYPALKPTTGAGNPPPAGTCTGAKNGMGAALVDWNADGSLALVATGSLPATVYAGQPGLASFPPGVGVPGAAVATIASKYLWYQMQGGNGALFNPAVPGAIGFDAVNNDESALAISRNNGETWNQISLIDTTIDWFNDVVVSPDCATIYLASSNRNLGTAGICNEFDSVWRASINPNVTAPLPAIPPLGAYWERVYARTTSGSCTVAQSDLPILRVIPSCTNKKDGEIVGWAAQGTRAMAWSPDYGDYWATITPRYTVQDFAFESATTMYIVNALGLVQKLPYTGTSWSTNLPGYATDLETTHSIVAIPDGKVLVGAATGSSYPAAYSADKGVTFSASGGQSIVGHGNEHVIFDVDFKNNSFIYMGDDNYVGASAAPGTVYRNTAPSWQRWSDNDMMSAINGAAYVFNGVIFPAVSNWPPAGPVPSFPAVDVPPHVVGQFGLVQAWTGSPQPALYNAHDNITTSVSIAAAPIFNSAVCRTLKPRDGMPKPGIEWDCLDIFSPLAITGVNFTLEPTSLKYCGCCTLDTNTTLYAIDDESGNWQYAAPVNTRTYTLDRSGRWNGGLTDPILHPVAGPGYTPTLSHGMLWAYTDCLAKKGPILKSPADKFLIGADPVTGRNQQIDLSWEQLCLSTWYQLQVAKDSAFTLRINPDIAHGGNSATVISAVTGSLLLEMDDVNMTSPAAWIAPGALPEAGAIYYWRIRSAKSVTSQIAASPWSEARSFTVKAGFIVNTPYYGVQLLAPSNGCTGCRTKPLSFSWSPWKEATKYQFDLARDPEFKTLVVTATTTTSGYEYNNALEYSSNYFWRVKAIEVNGQNIPSDWSATFSLTTIPVPAIPPPPAQEAPIPAWVWVLIAIGTVLVMAVLFLVFKTRRIY